MEVGLEYRLDYQLHRGLHNPVLYGRDAKRAEFAVRLLDVRPFYGTGLVGLPLELLSDCPQKALHSFRVMLDSPKRHPVNARRTLVGPHGFVGAS